MKSTGKFLQRGFTLIELVVVMVIIGILAAAALPKFVNLNSQATTAVNKGNAGAIAAAVSMVHASWIAQGSPTAGGTVSVEGSTAAINGYGWPAGGVATTPPAIPAANPTSCITAITAILNKGPTLTITTCTAGVNNCYVATASSMCTFTLANAVSATTITYDTMTGIAASP